MAPRFQSIFPKGSVPQVRMPFSLPLQPVAYSRVWTMPPSKRSGSAVNVHHDLRRFAGEGRLRLRPASGVWQGLLHIAVGPLGLGGMILGRTAIQRWLVLRCPGFV